MEYNETKKYELQAFSCDIDQGSLSLIAPIKPLLEELEEMDPTKDEKTKIGANLLGLIDAFLPGLDQLTGGPAEEVSKNQGLVLGT